MNEQAIKVLDHGVVELVNLTGPVRRMLRDNPNNDTVSLFHKYDADDTDPAHVARISFNQQDMDRAIKADLGLCRYLYEHKHTTPFEMIDVHLAMKLPIFVARQFIRHRTASVNEISGRYVQLDNEFYIPKPENITKKSKSNKQGRTLEPIDPVIAKAYISDLRYACNASYVDYEQSIKNEIPNELARLFLPGNIYTGWHWKQNLHNIMHMLRLRMDAHAQWEIQQYANAIHTLLSKELPHCMGLFDESVSEWEQFQIWKKRQKEGPRSIGDTGEG